MVALARVGGRHQPHASGRPHLPLGGHACHCGLPKPWGHAMLGSPGALRIACTHENEKHARSSIRQRSWAHTGTRLHAGSLDRARRAPPTVGCDIPASCRPWEGGPCPPGCPLLACTSCCSLHGTAACLLQRRWRCHLCGTSAPTPPRCSGRPTPASWAAMPASRRRRPARCTQYGTDRELRRGRGAGLSSPRFSPQHHRTAAPSSASS